MKRFAERTRIERLPGMLALLAAVMLMIPVQAFAQDGKRPLTHDDYDSWKSIRSQQISADGKSLLFGSNRREGRYGRYDIWQVSIDPVVDLNSDGIVDSLDMCIIVD